MVLMLLSTSLLFRLFLRGTHPFLWAVFLAVFFVIPSGSSWAEPRPRLEFEETAFDFGVLIQGATVQHLYNFKNKGDSPLVIESVSTSCGCTAAVVSDPVIKPGASSQIKAGYDSHGKFGNVQKFIVVHSNDPEKRTVNLVISGLVVESEHPQRTGTQNLFQGSCVSCHAERGYGKSGKLLYMADCAMCHEHHTMGGKFIAPSAEDMARMPKKQLRKIIRTGREGTSMPAYHKSRGGPLYDEDIASLVKYLKGSKK
jgi:mono/diheme cytochrome c family protein